jgi:hypothetical protein
MSYLGRNPSAYSNYSVKRYLAGTDFTAGTTTVLTLPEDPGPGNGVLVFIDGVYQESSEFLVQGTSLTFYSAIPSGTTAVEVRYVKGLNIGVPSDASVNTAKLATGSVTTEKIADANVTPAKISVNVFRKNAIINGDFNVWQRGNTFVSVADGAYTADRFGYSNNTAATHTMSRSTDVPTVAQAGRLFNYSLLVDCTNLDSSISAPDLCGIYQIIEGYNFLPLAQKIFTLSFWVKATKTGTYCVAFKNNGTGSVSDRSYVAEYTVSVSDTWEYKTITVSASPSAGTWNYTNGRGLIVAWALAASSTYQTTANAWNTGNFNATANQVNACDSTANDFRLCGVQLELGSTATDFEYRSFQDEIQLCQRYYFTSLNNGDWAGPSGTTYAMTYSGYVNSGNNYHVSFSLPVAMRIIPNVTWYEGTSNNFPGTDPTFSNGGRNSIWGYKAGSGTTAAGYWIGNVACSAEL